MKSVDQILNHRLLRDMLGKIMHEIWINWSTDIVREGLTPERLIRWQKYWKPYIQLSEEDREIDRQLADQIIETLKEYIEIIGTNKVFFR